jgi:hypothetical protein
MCLLAAQTKPQEGEMNKRCISYAYATSTQATKLGFSGGCYVVEEFSPERRLLPISERGFATFPEALAHAATIPAEVDYWSLERGSHTAPDLV